MISELKKNIDLAHVVRESGVELNDRGWGLCPFHAEKTPSFKVDPERQRWHCFGGCGTGGDCIDFVQKHQGVGFKEALQILGIDTRPQRISPEIKRQIQQRKKRAELVKRFRKWEVRKSNELGLLIRATHKVMRSWKSIKDLEKGGGILHPLPFYEHCLDILCSGNDEEKYKLWEKFLT